jgi:hypothetical protein
MDRVKHDYNATVDVYQFVNLMDVEVSLQRKFDRSTVCREVLFRVVQLL